MFDTKSWLTSTGIWGGIIAIVPSVLALAGVGAADATEATTHANTIMQSVMSAIAAVGGLLAIYGRWRATKKIG